MNVLQINASDTGVGGASRIALDLHYEYQKRGLDATFLSGTGLLSKHESFHKIPKQNFRKIVSRLFANDLEFFNTDYILQHDYYKNADIVHLHNIHGWYFNLKTLRKICAEKKVIWTLHDQWALTPHCAHTSIEKSVDGLFPCNSKHAYPSLLWNNTKYLSKMKKDVYENSSFLVTTPSHWLLKRVHKSVLSSKQSVCIPNGINTDIFFPKDKKTVRKRLNLPQHKKIILFVAAAGLSNDFKGGDLIKELIASDGDADNFYIVIGEKDHNLEQTYGNLFSYGPIVDQIELADFYSASDVALFPSQHEVFGLVAVESMACGTPVIVSNVGGMPETIISKEYGTILKERNIETIQDAIRILIERSSGLDVEKMHADICAEFSITVAADRYLSIYKDLLE